jgi:hypothetical protein
LHFRTTSSCRIATTLQRCVLLPSTHVLFELTTIYEVWSGYTMDRTETLNMPASIRATWGLAPAPSTPASSAALAVRASSLRSRRGRGTGLQRPPARMSTAKPPAPVHETAKASSDVAQVFEDLHLSSLEAMVKAEWEVSEISDSVKKDVKMLNTRLGALNDSLGELANTIRTHKSIRR